MTFRKAALGAASLIAIAGAGTALAADVAPDGRPIEEIVVYGQNVYRDRTADINPTLSYDLEFFQRFEPTTVGEMLKRVPGVVFTSDVLEYDAVQLRGLGSQYTQILVNGRKIPGQQANGSVFVDRIPAELIDRIEIIRSPSSDITGEGAAGTLNVILKEGADLDGAFARIGTSYFGDGDNALRYSGAAAVATAFKRDVEAEPEADVAVGTAAPAKANQAQQIAKARMQGYEGESCMECGNFTMVRNGTCLKCDTCGGTSGCS